MVGTSAGGIISLGLGLQQRTASDCIKIFRKICDDGFHVKPLTTSRTMGFIARLMMKSIYKTSTFEATVVSAFGSQPKQVFGRTNSTRVAVTTTVESKTVLIANYNLGDSDKYMRSEMPLWKAARCTSAAPILWGGKANFDLILSVGSGYAAKPADVPTAGSTKRSPHWLKPLVAAFISSMNGQIAWEQYIESQVPEIKEKSFRLNVEFRDGKHFRLPIEFNQQFNDASISIEVNFGISRSVPISGFPMAFKDLKSYWDDNKDDLGVAVPRANMNT
ncbi:hypothetical protein K4K61_003038 [Colletotrichum sp. SAR11_59]|nr:hypothetical protein K4K61_003038 [Colletotrichum sp. SAR11_59]